MPLWWDAGALDDQTAWKRTRERHGAHRDETLVCSLQRATFGRAINRHVLRRRFHNACRAFGDGRIRTLTIHHGRRTFVSHALAGGEVASGGTDGGGARQLVTTRVHLHVTVENEGAVGAPFG